jgi:tRNA (guanine37-N1)-methyltransferase
MRIHILTLFPEMFQALTGSSILKRAIERGLVTLDLVNFREYAHDRHKTVDDSPYGGGPGMVLKPEPLFEAVESLKKQLGEPETARLPLILLTPQGRLFSQAVARDLSVLPEIVLICGHYEGFDERIREHLATDEISIGDYVLTGGELAAMVVIDAMVRLMPGVLGSDESPLDESHAGGFLEYPQYTRPPDFRGWTVPEILLSGNHAQIARWRHEQARQRTAKKRPDLLPKAAPDGDTPRFLTG